MLLQWQFSNETLAINSEMVKVSVLSTLLFWLKIQQTKESNGVLKKDSSSYSWLHWVVGTQCGKLAIFLPLSFTEDNFGKI